MTNEKVPSVYLLAGILVPGIVMFGSRFVGQAPSTSNAQPVEQVVPNVIDFPVVSLNIEAQESRLQGVQSIISPFWFEEIVENPFPAPFEALENPLQSVQAGSPDIRVTTILPHPKNPLAIINSKPHRVGDVITGGWKLVKINGPKRTVTLLHTSGKQMTLSLSTNP